MNNSRYKIKLKLIMPHILYTKWRIEENAIKEFIKKFGYWIWEQSYPALKINSKDHMNIMGEQDSFLIYLEEGEKECTFFIPNDGKVYWVEYGRCVNNNIFIPFTSSNSLLHPLDKDYSPFTLPNNLIDQSILKKKHRNLLSFL